MAIRPTTVLELTLLIWGSASMIGCAFDETVAPADPSLPIEAPSAVLESEADAAEPSSGERVELARAAAAWFASRLELDDDPDPSRRSRLVAARNRDQHRFMRAWEDVADARLLERPEDVRAIFLNAFPYEERSGTGALARIEVEDGSAFSAAVPPGYSAARPVPCVVVIPDRVAGRWVDAAEHLANAWKGTALMEEAVFVVPELDDELELEPSPALPVVGHDEAETTRMTAVLRPFGRAQRTFRLDRDRVVLDCGVGSCRFGLRLVSAFPDRFAGLILRDPVDCEGIRLGSLTGLPVLVIAGPATRKAAEDLSRELNRSVPGACTLLHAADPAPHAELAVELAAWASRARRDLFRRRVVWAPNFYTYNHTYWVSARGSDPEPSDPPAHLEAEVVRVANRIDVTAQGIAEITLRLNDTLVDLDRDVTVVVNGVEHTIEPERSVDVMIELLYERFDPSYVFPFTCNVPVPARVR